MRRECDTSLSSLLLLTLSAANLFQYTDCRPTHRHRLQSREIPPRADSVNPRHTMIILMRDDYVIGGIAHRGVRCYLHLFGYKIQSYRKIILKH